MQLPPMLRAVQHQQQQQLLRQQQQGQNEEEKQISLSDIGYDLIDLAGNQFKKVAPYVNKTLEWGWFPLVIAIGLRQGTHKFYPSDTANVPDDMRDMPMERNASWTDAIPLVGSHGSSKPGILPSL
eukprot:CAMPEP_0202696598 /NCGR_PEP_ID=MMETSP1385-20130828/9890_1 /ASSEMBLY_ACC=CAM_ASM_000861 /TAXON_ID=933848 /ORGANISM="Elphidium margaritaceum" /LENGTH=125 /DNA_ID=CAMNT_0049352801 /DNA_START=72 /DNA_END=449 /DNA_ORIENTATION=-